MNVNLCMVHRLPVPARGRLCTPTILGTGDTFIWNRYVYTRRIWSAAPENGQHVANYVPCRVDVLARVNVASILSPYLCMKEN